MENSLEQTQAEANYNWVDVTKEFFDATNEMQLGELLHDELFGLFEAMSAIEMMDPKMDAGMLCNKSRKKILNFDQAVKLGKLKINDFTYEEQIGIIDDTIGCIVTWLEGHSLAQTVFINLYLHNPNVIVDKCIKAFSIVILKLVDIIREIVTKANVFEEEDFQPIVYGYQLANDINENKACAMLREVEDDCQKKLKAINKVMSNKVNNLDNTGNKVNNSDNTHQSHNVNNWNNNTLEEEQKLVSALNTRLKFVRLLFQSFALLKKESINKYQQQGKKQTTTNDNFVHDVEKLLQQCNENVPQWQQTIECGMKPDMSNTSGHRADYPTIMGFEPLINQRLLPPTFPRYTKMKNRDQAVEYLESLVNRLRYAIRIYNCNSFHNSLDFFNLFSKLTPSCVVSRSILQVLYFPHSNMVFGLVQITDVLRDAVKSFIKPPSLSCKSAILTNNSQAKELLDMFFNHCSRPMMNLTQICGHNRARQREKLAQILEELATLQEESEKVDSFLTALTQKTEPPCSHMGYFSTWILYHVLRVMINYLLSGFELELYASHEYPYIFWYLYEFLFGWMVSTLNRASNFIIEQENLLEQIQQKGRNNKKTKAKKRKQKPHYREIIFYQALQQLTNGFYKAICAFKLDNKLKLPWTGLNTEQIRFEHRFAPFRNVLAPPPVSYIQYKEMSNNRYLQHSSSELYNMACKCFQQAKTLFESISDFNNEISDYLKIAKTNFIVIKVLLSGHKANDQEYPSFDFSIHKNFPILRIYKNNS